ncbi:hypothetical protein BGW80DRAFT_1257206 [Lactifluus volemus]|nr:hypothetical protein BGW80DRAFT_1257206 [Lactifluus volemus]
MLCSDGTTPQDGKHDLGNPRTQPVRNRVGSAIYGQDEKSLNAGTPGTLEAQSQFSPDSGRLSNWVACCHASFASEIDPSMKVPVVTHQVRRERRKSNQMALLSSPERNLRPRQTRSWVPWPHFSPQFLVIRPNPCFLWHARVVNVNAVRESMTSPPLMPLRRLARFITVAREFVIHVSTQSRGVMMRDELRDGYPTLAGPAPTRSWASNSGRGSNTQRMKYPCLPIDKALKAEPSGARVPATLTAGFASKGPTHSTAAAELGEKGVNGVTAEMGADNPNECGPVILSRLSLPIKQRSRLVSEVLRRKDQLSCTSILRHFPGMAGSRSLSLESTRLPQTDLIEDTVTCGVSLVIRADSCIPGYKLFMACPLGCVTTSREVAWVNFL